MAQAHRVPLVEREVRERLSGAAIGILLDRAAVLSEGARSASPSAKSAFFGTTMLTISLDEIQDLVRERATPKEAARLAALMADDARVLKRVRKIAEREAQRLSGAPIRVRTEVSMRAEGHHVFVDIDVESAPLQRAEGA